MAAACSVAFSPDSSRLVSASFDKTAKLWDVTTGQELLTLGGFQQQVSGISFSPNGRQLATASREGTVKVWDARDFDIQHLTRAARGVVARHSADSATRQELIVAIKSDPMLDERTRQQAIDFTEYFRENPNVYEARGRQLAARGELAKAAVNFGRAFDLRPDNVNLAQNWSYLLFSSGNVDEYRKACAKALLGFEHSDDARTLLVTVRILILSPGATDDSASPIRLAVRAVKLDPKLWWCHHALAGAYLRNKQYEEALKTLNEIEERKLVPDPPAPDSWLAEILNGSLRTVALLKLKRVTEARVAMEKVQTTSEQHLKPTPEMSFGEITPFWWNWYPIQAFRNEAADLLHEIDGSK